MLAILEGEQCGQCHGAVAFPLTECTRCHAIPQKDFPALENELGLVRVGPRERAAIRRDTAAARQMLQGGDAADVTAASPAPAGMKKNGRAK
jgi:hypothetical protein